MEFQDFRISGFEDLRGFEDWQYRNAGLENSEFLI
jgi:hypothetical protein